MSEEGLENYNNSNQVYQDLVKVINGTPYPLVISAISRVLSDLCEDDKVDKFGACITDFIKSWKKMHKIIDETNKVVEKAQNELEGKSE